MHDDRDITQDIPLVAEPGQRPGSDCPDETVLAGYADSMLGADQRAALEDHLADCSFCLGQVGFLVREAEREVPTVPVRLLEAVRGQRRSWQVWPLKPAWPAFAAAATLIVAAAVVLQLDRAPDLSAPSSAATDAPVSTTSPAAPERTVRSGSAADGLLVLEPQEGAVLDGPEIEIRWQPSQQALQYEVLVVSLQGDLLWEASTERSKLTVPPTALTAGERHYLWIEAQLPGGGTIKSATVGFQLAPD